MTAPLTAAGIALALLGALAVTVPLPGSDDGAGSPVAQVRSADASAAGVASASYGWPTGVPAEVVRAFDDPTAPWAPGHRGVDLAALPGAPVRAAGPGAVVFAGWVVDRPLVSVQHPDGLRTTYEPVEPSVTAGQAVAAGGVIGTVAADPLHCPSGCLHWGARRGPDDYVDPLALLRPTVVRLYPAG